LSAPHGVRELFVWYRVRDEHAGAARAAVESLQRSLVETCPGLQARLLVRRGAGVQTWMETYARPPRTARDDAGIDAAIEATIAVAALQLRDWIEGERHVEAFEAAGAR